MAEIIQYMEILHSKIYVEDQPGTPLLVLHGLFGMLDNWGNFAREASQHFPVHLLDLRNHGKSFWSDSMSHQDMAEDIFNYCTARKLTEINLLGHSLGGKAVMQFAINHPEMVEKLIVADISPKAYPPHHQGIIKALQSVDFQKVSSRKEVEEILHSYIPETSVIQFLTKNIYWTDDKKLAWRFNLKVLAEKYSEFVSNAVQFGVYRGKTLFMAGEKSHYILPQDHFLIKQQFPEAEIVPVPNAGHWLHAENPEFFNETVLNFLKG